MGHNNEDAEGGVILEFTASRNIFKKIFPEGIIPPTKMLEIQADMP